MKLVVQRCKMGNVVINNKVNGKVDVGFVILVGFTYGDNELIINKMIDKLIHLRIFEDENEKMNKSILDVNGTILSISQFTLYANCKEGRRPSFNLAMKADEASKLYDIFNEKLNKFVHTETGIFGSDMQVTLQNDGPVTIILDSEELFK